MSYNRMSLFDFRFPDAVLFGG